jgi:hypothetical protein
VIMLLMITLVQPWRGEKYTIFIECNYC